MSLFIFIEQNLVKANNEDLTSSYRNAFLNALRKDYPDFQDILNKAMLSKSPSGSFKVFYDSLVEACQGDNSVKYSAHADFLKKHFNTYTNILNPALSSRLNIKGFIGIPEFMVVSNSEFFKKKKGVNNFAARWVAQALLHFKSDQSDGIGGEVKDKQKAYNRLTSLISDLTAKEIADHMTFLYPGWETSDRYNNVVDASVSDEPLSVLVSRLFKDAKENVSKLNDVGFTDTFTDPEIIKGGNLESFIQGRIEFKKKLNKKIKKEGEAGAALWLQEPEVQKEIRSLAAQRAMVSSLKDFQDQESKNKIFSSYIDSIQDRDDFSAVLHSLCCEKYGDLSSYAFTANLIQKSAALKYSTLDAIALIEGIFFKNNYLFGNLETGRNVSDFENLAKITRNDDWNAEDINNLWSVSQRKINSSIAYVVSSAAVAGDPDGIWPNLSEYSITSMLDYVSGFILNEYKSDQKSEIFSQMIKRIPSLSLENRSNIAVKYITRPLYPLYLPGEVPAEHKEVISLAMKEMNDTQRKGVEDAVLATSSSAGALLVSKVDRLFNPEKIISSLLSQNSNTNNRYLPIDAVSLMAIVKLSGYESDKPSPSLNLSSIDEGIKIKIMAGLSAVIASESFTSVMSKIGNSPFKDGMSTRAVNVLKNIVFDIHDSIPEERRREGELLNSSSFLIKEGFLARNQKISWDGVCVLIAPFLSEPRPTIDFAQDNSVKENQSLKKHDGEELLLLNKNAIQEKLKNWRSEARPEFVPYELQMPIKSRRLPQSKHDYVEDHLTIKSFRYMVCPPLMRTPPLMMLPSLFVEPVIAFNASMDLFTDRLYLKNDLKKENELAKKRVLK